MPDELPVLKERFRYLHKEVEELKGDLKESEQENRKNQLTMERMQFQLKSIQTDLKNISTTLSKDTGWRGFFLDFIKAAAQIAALVGAGKFIF